MKEGFLSFSKLPEYKKRINEAKKNIEFLFSKYNTLSVSVSGGKDSLVLLDLCLKMNPSVKVWHWDYGIYMPRPIENEVLSILQNHFHLSSSQLTISIRTSNDTNSSTGYRAFFAANSKYNQENQIDMNLLGLRQQESCKRKKRCSKLIEDKSKCAFPIRSLTWEDIWAYLISNRIPYPSPYNIRGPLLGWDRVRFVTFFDHEFEHLGSIQQDQYFFWNYRTMNS